MSIRAAYRSKALLFGSGNNVANSLIVGGIKAGMKVSAACPPYCQPEGEVTQWAERQGNFVLTDNCYEAAQDADVICTDTCIHGAERNSDELLEKLKQYLVNDKLMEAADKNAMVLHCLPAYRGRKSAKVFEEHAGEILMKQKTGFMFKRLCFKMLEELGSESDRFFQK